MALDRHGVWLRALPTENGRWRIRADLARTDPTFLARLIRIEDANFTDHLGVEPSAVVRAAALWALSGRPRSGASTLTMQTARLLSPHRRSLAGKALEMIRAAQIETRLSKRQILALYLTLAPYGGNLEGVRAASLAWFGHEPASLTDGEQALLIALPQAPEARRPDRHPAAARKARAAVLARMLRLGLIDRARAAEAAAEPLPAHRRPFPSLAWHASGELARAAPAGEASVVTTLDAALQARIEPMVRAVAAGQGAESQAAAVMIEVRGRAVRASVGSAGRDVAGGWIDLTRALRSPGSALKPLIYGFAFDDGLAAPDTQLEDAPRRFADYAPEDFDRVFHGPVTAREALEWSLNVPAVALLDRIGPAAFEARLAAAGARLERPKHAVNDAGLSLALGGEGISLRDLALLYAALDDEGMARPLAWTAAQETHNQGGVRLLRPRAARQVLDILADAPGPGGRAPSSLMRGSPSLAYKTGTSYGFRDALAVGVGGGYVIAVWTGRADGGARGGLTGREAALPLLFDIADALSVARSAPPSIAPRAAPRGLTRLARAAEGPHMVFPPDGATVLAPGFGPQSSGFSLAASGEGLRWYVDGSPLTADAAAGRPLWRPPGPGFYEVTVVDGEGRSARARVRVKGG